MKKQRLPSALKSIAGVYDIRLSEVQHICWLESYTWLPTSSGAIKITKLAGDELANGWIVYICWETPQSELKQWFMQHTIKSQWDSARRANQKIKPYTPHLVLNVDEHPDLVELTNNRAKLWGPDVELRQRKSGGPGRPRGTANGPTAKTKLLLEAYKKLWAENEHISVSEAADRLEVGFWKMQAFLQRYKYTQYLPCPKGQHAVKEYQQNEYKG